jgi:hypothetical protein
MTYDHWKTTEPDSDQDSWLEKAAADERELLYESIRKLRASHDRLLAAAKEVVDLYQYSGPTQSLSALRAEIAAAEETLK